DRASQDRLDRSEQLASRKRLAIYRHLLRHDGRSYRPPRTLTREPGPDSRGAGPSEGWREMPHSSRFELCSPSGRPAEVLVAAPLHPFPPRCGSAVRIAQYIRYLAGRGASVDLAVLSDSPSREKDLECAQEALRHCSRVLVVRHPVVSSPLLALGYRLWGRTAGFRLGDWLHAPPRFVRALRRFARRRYRAVIVSGVHLARLAGLFGPSALRVLEAQDVWYDRYRSYSALGRGAEFANFADPLREARLA